MNMGVEIYLWDPDFNLLDIYPGVRLLDYMVNLLLIFWETSVLFSKVAVSFYIPTKSSNYSMSLPTLNIFCFYDSNQSKRCEFISHCVFDSHFPDGNFEHLFIYLHISFHILLSICMSFLKKCLFKSLPIFKLDYSVFLFVWVFLAIELKVFLVYFRY